MSLSEAIAAVVKALRQNSNLTQDDLTLIGRSHRSRVERGKTNATMETIAKLATMLDVDSALLVLLASSLQSGESPEATLKRLSAKLDALKQNGVLDLITFEQKPTAGRSASRDTLKALERAPTLKQAGMSLSEIARELGVSRSSVHRYLAKLSN